MFSVFVEYFSAVIKDELPGINQVAKFVGASEYALGIVCPAPVRDYRDIRIND
jgi:hypothetical protein